MIEPSNKSNPSSKDKPVYFISDAHLLFDVNAKEELLAEFLDSIKHLVGYLYIIGDLFDFWFEYKQAIPAAYLGVLSALRNLTDAGIQVIYLPGNHDFWLGDYLTRQVGVQIAGDSLDIEHQGKKIHVVHGDGLAYDDLGYRIMKRIFRFKPNIWLYRLLPADLAYWLARRTSAVSREYTSAKQSDLKGYYDYATKKIKAGCDAVIMGHTHMPEIKSLDHGIYINTGDWISHNSYAILQNGEFRLEYYKNGGKS
jgi:UDP-2,3-diacylglucosamine hydrolase